MSARVRPAAVDDAERVAAITREVAAERRWIPRSPEEAPDAKGDAEAIANGPAKGLHFFVAELDGRVVGVLTVKRGERIASRHAADLGLCVERAARGRGVGRALMLAAEAWAREVGVRKLCLGVFHDNAPARRLYEGLGYQKEGTRLGQFEIDGRMIDEVLMAKQVGP